MGNEWTADCDTVNCENIVIDSKDTAINLTLLMVVILGSISTVSKEKGMGNVKDDAPMLAHSFR